MKQFINYFSITNCCSIAKYFLLVIVLFIVAIFLSVFAAKCLDFWFDDLSTWVQAMGTILAIIGGFSATIWQINRQRTRMNQQAEQIYKSTYDAAKYICVRINNIQSDNPKSRRQKSKATKATEIINNIPYIVLSHAFQNQLELLSYFNSILISLVAVNEGMNDHKDNGSNLNSSIKSLNEAEELWDKWNITLTGYVDETKPFPRNASE